MARSGSFAIRSELERRAPQPQPLSPKTGRGGARGSCVFLREDGETGARDSFGFLAEDVVGRARTLGELAQTAARNQSGLVIDNFESGQAILRCGWRSRVLVANREERANLVW